MNDHMLPQDNTINVSQLSNIFNKMSESYKIFWFRSLFDAIKKGKTTVTYDELVNHMILDAWYMVSEYKLNLGPSDNLERLILYLQKTKNLKTNEKKSDIEKILRSNTDPEYKRIKGELIKFVPYRLQVPFMPGMRSKDLDVSPQRQIDKINSKSHLIYYFNEYKAMNTKISIQDDWYRYLYDNQVIIEGWIEYNMIDYLQRRNPNVPGIINKLYPPEKRNLDDIKKLWRMCITVSPMDEIYRGQSLNSECRLSIDHFVPWSFVTHDEMWNLHPTLVSINSSKSNFLPDWDKYFGLFSNMEYKLYTIAQKYEEIRNLFEKCKKTHINDMTVRNKLYKDGLTKEEFCNTLEAVMQPVYKAAMNQGFEVRKKI